MITLLNRFDDHHIIDMEDVLEITSKYLRDNNIESSLRDVNFTKEDDLLIDFNNRNNEMSINMNSLLERSKSLYKELKDRYNIDDKYESYFINFELLHYIYNGLEHINQKAKISSINDELYKYLILLSNSIKENDFSFYKENRLLIPSEIESNNTSLLTAYNLLDYTKLPGRETNIMHLIYMKNLLLNYDKKNNYQVSSPVELLKDKNNDIDLDKIYELLNKSRYNKKKRINLGLPITSSEYNSIDNEINKKLIKKI